MKNLLVIAILAGLAWFGYSKYTAASQSDAATELATTGVQYTPASDQSRADANPAFKCDGRTHCSQMTSCEEATYFIQHCPNTKMDGNNDGEPCEQQWCN